VTVATFAVFFAIPGGEPERRIAGRTADPTTLAQVRRDFGLDEPAWEQYWLLMRRTADGTLISYTDRTNVREEVVRGIPATASLVVGAAIIWVVLGVLLGVAAARWAGRWPDRVLRGLSTLAISLPVFWVAAVSLYYLTSRHSVLPPGGYVPLTDDPLRWAEHLVLPWLVLALPFVGLYGRLLRSSLLDTLGEDHVRAAEAKGLRAGQVMWRHVLRNAMLPLVALFGLDLGAALGGGAILTEAVFGLQGVGQYAADAVGALDLPPVMGTTIYAAVFIVLFSALADIVYAGLDPRVRMRA
jgi:peptide/nickel transport system permease protein